MRLPLSGSLRLVATGIALGLGVVLGVVLARRGALLVFPGHTTISESVVIERLDAVAKLITTEAMVRDVITYENTRLGSTKRSLVIVTGKTLVGLDLRTPPRINIRQRDRHARYGLTVETAKDPARNIEAVAKLVAGQVRAAPHLTALDHLSVYNAGFSAQTRPGEPLLAKLAKDGRSYFNAAYVNSALR